MLVVIDPITAYSSSRYDERVKLMLIRAVDLFKSLGITSMFTALTFGGDAEESTSVSISSVVDVWILVRNLELGGERTRGLYVCKARGAAHSNQIREFLLTNEGLRLVDVMLDDNGQILTGSARRLYQAMKEDEMSARELVESRRRAEVQNRQQLLEARIAAMRAEHEEELRALEEEIEGESKRLRAADKKFVNLASLRSRLGNGDS